MLVEILLKTDLIVVFLFIYFACARRRPSNFKKPPTKDDIRENIINYCDEGGGENDMTTFDMKTLKVPLGQLPELVQHKVPVTSKYKGVHGLI